ncbi:D-alanine--D-alanine ligase family protein [Lacrimispora brassicae]
MEAKEIHLLFLAHYAPESISAPIPTGIQDIVYAEYHHKIFQVLKLLFPKAYSSRDPAIMLQSNISADYIFSLYNRMPFRNSEVFVSAVAEYHGISYLGARPNIRALAEDKHLAKMLSTYAEVPTPAWRIYNIGMEMCPPDFDPPYFCKPRFGAASIGIDENSACSSWATAKEKIAILHNNGMDAILEKQIIGTYHTSPVLNNFGDFLFLPCIAQHSTLRGGIVTYGQKRKIESGLTRTIVQDLKLQKQLQDLSRRMYPLLQPLDYTRFDYIVEDGTGIPYFLEFNVCCNLGEHSTISQAAAHIGINYVDLIANITYSSLFRNGLLDDSGRKKF